MIYFRSFRLENDEACGQKKTNFIIKFSCIISIPNFCAEKFVKKCILIITAMTTCLNTDLLVASHLSSCVSPCLCVFVY